jgi:geranylgeranyl reductase family protein
VTPPSQTDLLVVGAGPSGSAAAAWAARSGREVLLADAAAFPRDKPCGDGLTPRAVAELEALGLASWLDGRPRNWGLRAAGFGQSLYLPWPGGSLPKYGSAAPRTELDARIREVALASGAVPLESARAVDVVRVGDRIAAVVFKRGSETFEVRARQVVVSDGARSQLGRLLGREWHRDTAYGVAARGYIKSARSDDPWISSHLELRGEEGEILSGYGWIFPLGDGEVNVGVGTLAVDRRPADLNLRRLLAVYADQQRDEWGLDGQVRAPWSALLPMGGAVSGVAGPNWVMVGDAAGCVNPLNGEGIDYGLETGRLAASVLAEALASAGLSSHAVGLEHSWPAVLREHYGEAFSIARRLAGLLTVPGLLPAAGPVGMRSRRLMTVALRVMGNLITPEDTDAVARAWRTAGRLSTRLDPRPPWS